MAESSGFGGYATVGLTALSIGSMMEEQKGVVKAVNDQMDRERDAAIYSASMTAEEVARMDHELSIYMSKTEVQSLKDEATLKAMNTASGLSGTISKDLISQASASKRESDETAVAQTRSKQRQALSSMVQNEISFKNKMTNLTSSLMTGTQAGMKSLNAGLQGFQIGASFMSADQQQAYWEGN